MFPMILLDRSLSTDRTPEASIWARGRVNVQILPHQQKPGMGPHDEVPRHKHGTLYNLPSSSASKEDGQKFCKY